jgi:hypothetical protein
VSAATTPSSAASVRQPTCGQCGTALTAGDRFCGACGWRVPESAQAAPVGDRPLLDQIADRTQRVGDRTANVAPFCRACGGDLLPDATICPSCSGDVRPVGPPPSSPLGVVHPVRRKMLRRNAVRIGTEGEAAVLLLESGERLEIPVDQLRDQVPSPVPEDAYGGPARTAHGELVRLAEACAAGVVRAKWDPGELLDAAFVAVTDDTTARALALDLLAIGCPELVERLPLTPSERTWIQATDKARRGDHVGVVEAVAALPADGYRPKLDLILGAWRGALDAGADLRPLAPHLAWYEPDRFPIAASLQRVLGFAARDVGATLASARGLLATSPLPTSLSAELMLVAAVLADEELPDVQQAEYLGSAARTLLAHATGGTGLVRAADVESVPAPVLDDLIDAGVLGRTVALDGARSDARSLHVRSRLTPQKLSDAEVRKLGHDEERLRRAFRRHDVDTLERAGESPTRDHYLALDALRAGRPQRAAVEAVLLPQRDVVADLLALAAGVRDGAAPSELLTDRMLTDATTWPVVVELAGSTGIVPTAALRERFPAFAEWLSLIQARDFLFRGAWSEAVAAADRCLDLAEIEDVRDEALSLKACGLHYMGQDGLAVAALEQALDGAYSEGLLANMGIVAANLDPETAARYLGRLMDEAPTIAMRTAAAHRALTIWSVSDTSAWRNSDDSPLPDAFQDALRRLVAAPGLELDDFRSFARLLAIQDSEWFANVRNLAGSPHEGSLEGRFFRARAGDLHRMIEIMGESIRTGSPPPWLLHERDSLREAAVEILLTNLDEPDNTFGSVALAMADNNVLADAYDHLLLTLLGIAGVCYHLSDQGQEIGDRIVGLVHSARRDWQALGPEDRDRVAPFVELATRRAAINRMLARDRDISQAIDLYNGALDRGRYAAPDSYQYRQALQAIARAADAVRAARADLLPWVPLVDHAGAREDIEKSIAMTRELERKALEILN